MVSASSMTGMSCLILFCFGNQRIHRLCCRWVFRLRNRNCPLFYHLVWWSRLDRRAQLLDSAHFQYSTISFSPFEMDSYKSCVRHAYDTICSSPCSLSLSPYSMADTSFPIEFVSSILCIDCRYLHKVFHPQYCTCSYLDLPPQWWCCLCLSTLYRWWARSSAFRCRWHRWRWIGELIWIYRVGFWTVGKWWFGCHSQRSWTMGQRTWCSFFSRVGCHSIQR